MADKKPMSANAKLRHDRLTFYKNDVDKIDKLLAEFLRLSGAKCALLIDKEGHLVTKRGELRIMRCGPTITFSIRITSGSWPMTNESVTDNLSRLVKACCKAASKMCV